MGNPAPEGPVMKLENYSANNRAKPVFVWIDRCDDTR